jgi:uncharacterized damage-inducible protein DinB
VKKAAAGRVGDLLLAFRGAFERDGWHGPSLLGLLREVPGKVAGKRPRGTPYSIHDLVEHIAFWEEQGLRQLRGERSGGAGDWTRPRRSFPRSVAHLKKVHASLVRAIRGLRESDLDRVVVAGEGPMSAGKALHGVVAHAVYHSGQIALLNRRLL